MTPKQRNILTHIWFVPEGTAITSPSAGNVSRTVWPDASDASLSGLTYKLVQAKKVTKSAPGGTRVEEWEVGVGSLQLYDAYHVKNNAKYMVTVTRVYALLWGLLHNAADPLTAGSTTFVPNSGKAAIRGVLVVQHYDQDSAAGDAPIHTANIYALLTLPSDVPLDPESAEGTPFEITLEQLSSPNNEGDITTPA